MTKDNGGAAFPFNGQWRDGLPSDGMSLRDWFAGQAISGFTANTDFMMAAAARAEEAGKQAESYLAQTAYEIADAMLKERSK